MPSSEFMPSLSSKPDTVADQDNHPMQTHFMAMMASLSLGLLLSACSPSQNWRDVRFEGSSFQAQLPCKPDRATRSVPLGATPVELQVAGCESGSAMVAVMTTLLPAGADANALLVSWQEVTLDNARVARPLAIGQSQMWQRAGLLPLAASGRVHADGLQANGQSVQMDAVWGAIAEGNRVRLVHGVVYDRGQTLDLANTLFEGLKP
jgi:hypothetical protein